MFAVIRRYNIHPGTVSTVLEKVSNDFVGRVSQLPGFISYQVVSANDDTLVSISVFETKGGADESNRLSTDWVRANLHKQLRNAPVITAGEVAVAAAASTASDASAPQLR